MTTGLNISAYSPTTASSAADRALFTPGTDTKRDDFAAVIGRFEQGKTESPEELARRAAEQFVSIALVQPLLKQLRDTNQTAPPFAPSQGEKQFQTLMDAEVAQRMVRAAHFPLVDRLAQDMLSRVRGKGVENLFKPAAAKPQNT